jgi:cupin 2 domain-containing protein
MKNIYSGIPADLPEEFIENLAGNGNVRIERIISRGHATPPGKWYDQDRDEFVILLQGAARLDWEGGEQIRLKPGDWLVIPARRRHRVNGTAEGEDTVWLTVHFK